MKYIANPVEVEAWKIVAVGSPASDGQKIRLEGELDLWRVVPPEMTARMTPKVGDYYVLQSDGYVYLNPKDVFERKYSPAPGQASISA
jgi:hypothetical protein